MATSRPRLSETKLIVNNYSPLLPFLSESNQTGLCTKHPGMRSLGDIALNQSLRKSKRE